MARAGAAAPGDVAAAELPTALRLSVVLDPIARRLDRNPTIRSDKLPGIIRAWQDTLLTRWRLAFTVTTAPKDGTTITEDRLLMVATRPPDDPQWVEWESGALGCRRPRLELSRIADAISAASGIENDPD